MNVKAGKTNSDPQFVLPTLNLSANTSGPVSINFITWNTNIYNDSDPIPINTNIVGLKIKTSADQSEIKIKDINQTIRIEIPIPDYNPAQISRSFSCIFYHEETQKWSDDGCAFTGIEKKGNNTYVGVCRCTHLTDFSISDQFGSLITNSGFQYFGSASDAFANGKIASLKGTHHLHSNL